MNTDNIVYMTMSGESNRKVHTILKTEGDDDNDEMISQMPMSEQQQIEVIIFTS